MDPSGRAIGPPRACHGPPRAAFCTDTADRHGEMQVIEIINYREVSRHASLAHFLEFYRDLLEGWVRAEEQRG